MATEAYWKDNDLYGAYIRDNIEFVRNQFGLPNRAARISLGRLYQNFQHWFKQNYDQRMISRVDFYQEMLKPDRLGQVEKGHFIGIRLAGLDNKADYFKIFQAMADRHNLSIDLLEQYIVGCTVTKDDRLYFFCLDSAGQISDHFGVFNLKTQEPVELWSVDSESSSRPGSVSLKHDLDIISSPKFFSDFTLTDFKIDTKHGLAKIVFAAQGKRNVKKFKRVANESVGESVSATAKEPEKIDNHMMKSIADLIEASNDLCPEIDFESLYPVIMLREQVDFGSLYPQIQFPFVDLQSIAEGAVFGSSLAGSSVVGSLVVGSSVARPSQKPKTFLELLEETYGPQLDGFYWDRNQYAWYVTDKHSYLIEFKDGQLIRYLSYSNNSDDVMKFTKQRKAGEVPIFWQPVRAKAICFETEIITTPIKRTTAGEWIGLELLDRNSGYLYSYSNDGYRSS